MEEDIPLPFEHKRVADTSAIAYREIAPTLGPRQAVVLEHLRRLCVPPTAYELFHEMHDIDRARDLNSVRPRLTELQDLGLVERIDKRACSVTGKLAWTWGVKEKA